MKRKNRSERKEKRQEEAKIRQEFRDKLTEEKQLQVLDDHGMRAIKERLRLRRKIEDKK